MNLLFETEKKRGENMMKLMKHILIMRRLCGIEMDGLGIKTLKQENL